MSLDLTSTALQIDSMAQQLKARETDRQRRLQTALEAAGSLDVDAYQRKRAQSISTLNWSVPHMDESPDAAYSPPEPPDDFCVVAVDGSHIDVDRHMPARCFLINIGAVVLRYGSHPDARLSNSPYLYASDDELVIRDSSHPYREQVVEGALLGVKRTVDELRALVDTARDLPPDVPTLALVDGSLVLFGLMGSAYPDFVLRNLVEEGFAQALEDMRQMAQERPLALASYISLPRSPEVVNALRVNVCPYEVSDCNRHCGTVIARQRPCDLSVGGLLDRDLFSRLLSPRERSAVFRSAAPVVEKYYGGHGVSFFYVNAGEEIGRVEVPSWVAEDERMLGLAHSLLMDQCRLGPGYPTSLMEAHEQAVITGQDRRYFVSLVEDAVSEQGLVAYTSEKNRSKRLRWL